VVVGVAYEEIKAAGTIPLATLTGLVVPVVAVMDQQGLHLLFQLQVKMEKVVVAVLVLRGKSDETVGAVSLLFDTKSERPR
jgi:hypothetical protein